MSSRHEIVEDHRRHHSRKEPYNDKYRTQKTRESIMKKRKLLLESKSRIEESLWRYDHHRRHETCRPSAYHKRDPLPPEKIFSGTFHGERERVSPREHYHSSYNSYCSHHKKRPKNYAGDSAESSYHGRRVGNPQCSERSYTKPTVCVYPMSKTGRDSNSCFQNSELRNGRVPYQRKECSSKFEGDYGQIKQKVLFIPSRHDAKLMSNWEENLKISERTATNTKRKQDLPNCRSSCSSHCSKETELNFNMLQGRSEQKGRENYICTDQSFFETQRHLPLNLALDIVEARKIHRDNSPSMLDPEVPGKQLLIENFLRSCKMNHRSLPRSERDLQEQITGPYLESRNQDVQQENLSNLKSRVETNSSLWEIPGTQANFVEGTATDILLANSRLLNLLEPVDFSQKKHNCSVRNHSQFLYAPEFRDSENEKLQTGVAEDYTMPPRLSPVTFDSIPVTKTDPPDCSSCDSVFYMKNEEIPVLEAPANVEHKTEFEKNLYGHPNVGCGRTSSPENIRTVGVIPEDNYEAKGCTQEYEIKEPKDNRSSSVLDLSKVKTPSIIWQKQSCSEEALDLSVKKEPIIKVEPVEEPRESSGVYGQPLWTDQEQDVVFEGFFIKNSPNLKDRLIDSVKENPLDYIGSWSAENQLATIKQEDTVSDIKIVSVQSLYIIPDDSTCPFPLSPRISVSSLEDEETKDLCLSNSFAGIISKLPSEESMVRSFKMPCGERKEKCNTLRTDAERININSICGKETLDTQTSEKHNCSSIEKSFIECSYQRQIAKDLKVSNVDTVPADTNMDKTSTAKFPDLSQGNSSTEDINHLRKQHLHLFEYKEGYMNVLNCENNRNSFDIVALDARNSLSSYNTKELVDPQKASASRKLKGSSVSKKTKFRNAKTVLKKDYHSSDNFVRTKDTHENKYHQQTISAIKEKLTPEDVSETLQTKAKFLESPNFSPGALWTSTHSSRNYFAPNFPCSTGIGKHSSEKHKRKKQKRAKSKSKNRRGGERSDKLSEDMEYTLSSLPLVKMKTLMSGNNKDYSLTRSYYKTDEPKKHKSKRKTHKRDDYYEIASAESNDRLGENPGSALSRDPKYLDTKSSIDAKNKSSVWEWHDKATTRKRKKIKKTKCSEFEKSKYPNTSGDDSGSFSLSKELDYSKTSDKLKQHRSSKRERKRTSDRKLSFEDLLMFHDSITNPKELPVNHVMSPNTLRNPGYKIPKIKRPSTETSTTEFPEDSSSRKSAAENGKADLTNVQSFNDKGTKLPSNSDRMETATLDFKANPLNCYINVSLLDDNFPTANKDPHTKHSENYPVNLKDVNNHESTTTSSEDKTSYLSPETKSTNDVTTKCPSPEAAEIREDLYSSTGLMKPNELEKSQSMIDSEDSSPETTIKTAVNNIIGYLDGITTSCTVKS